MQEIESATDGLLQSGFIHRLRCEAVVTSGLKKSGCHFDLTRFEPVLFDMAGVAMPETIAGSVPKRQAEYLAGRYLAAKNLAALLPHNTGVPDVGTGAHRNPVWPAGFLGSISHCDDYAVCVLALTSDFEYLGIDLESYLSPVVCQEVASTILVGEEIELLIACGLAPETALTVIFSAKESLFKALYPKVGEYFDFECAQVVSVDSEANILTLALQAGFAQKHRLPEMVMCRYSLGAQRVETLVAVNTGVLD